MNMEPVAAWEVTPPMAIMVLLLSIGFLKQSIIPIPLLSSFSLSMAATITAASSSTSAPSGLNLASDFTPSARRPFNNNHLGLSGIKNRATTRNAGTI